MESKTAAAAVPRESTPWDCSYWALCHFCCYPDSWHRENSIGYNSSSGNSALLFFPRLLHPLPVAGFPTYLHTPALGAESLGAECARYTSAFTLKYALSQWICFHLPWYCNIMSLQLFLWKPMARHQLISMRAKLNSVISSGSLLPFFKSQESHSERVISWVLCRHFLLHIFPVRIVAFGCSTVRGSLALQHPRGAVCQTDIILSRAPWCARAVHTFIHSTALEQALSTSQSTPMINVRVI